MKKYRPSNGTEGCMFMEHYCFRCVHDRDAEIGEGCEIVCNTMCFEVEDDEYPQEWTYTSEGQPTCTKFELDKEDS